VAASPYQIHCINRGDDRRDRGGAMALLHRRAGHDAEVIVALGKYGRKYLKTALDGLHPDSLLALPECR